MAARFDGLIIAVETGVVRERWREREGEADGCGTTVVHILSVRLKRR